MSSKLHLIVSHGEGFVGELKAAMKDELAIASRKWGVNLSKAEEAFVLETALKQLRLRVEAIAGHPWNYTPEVTYVLAGKKATLRVPSPEASKSPLRLVRASDAWKVDPDREETSIPLGEFAAAARGETLAWARTAVYYGVGSYKN